MTEKPQKYGAIAGLRKAQQPPSETPQPPSGPLLPAKPKPQGKRSDPDWKQYSVLLKKESHKQASLILRQKYEGVDISDLMQALLAQWIRGEKQV
jgi:hypothetical protein